MGVAFIDMSPVVRMFALPASSVYIAQSQQPGNWVNGRFEEAARTNFGLTFCTVIPVDGDELQTVPEALRTREALQFFSQDQIRPVKRETVQSSDLLLYNGHTYEPLTDANWNAQANYWDVVALKVDQ